MKFKKKKRLLLLGMLSVLSFSSQAALEGTLETVNCDQIKGWAWDNANSTKRVKVAIYDVGATKPSLLTTLTAQIFRTDLLNAGKGDGKYGFSFLLPASVRNAAKHSISVKFARTTTELTTSPQITAQACYGKLNDTGIQTCSKNNSNGFDCPLTDFVGQDGDYGRDALAGKNKLLKIGKGAAGFDFTKIANDGSVLSFTAQLGSGAKDWACTRDNVTGLIWEIKTTDGGLRDQNNTYSWYNPDNTTNGGDAGYQNLG